MLKSEKKSGPKDKRDVNQDQDYEVNYEKKCVNKQRANSAEAKRTLSRYAGRTFHCSFKKRCSHC